MMNEDDEIFVEQFNIALEGRKLWIEIKERYGICGEDGIVICVTAKTEWLQEIENWVLPFIERKRFNRLLYISSNRLNVDNHKFIQIILDDDIVSKIIKYYRLTNLTPKMYIISLNEPFGNENMIGHKGITIADWLKNWINRSIVMLANPEELNYIRKRTKQWITDHSLDGKRIAIFGCNAYARNIRDIIEEYGYKVDCILDNSVKKQGHSALNVKIVSPKEFLNDSDHIAVIIYSSYENEMLAQLEAYNVKIEQSVLHIPFRGYMPAVYNTMEDFEEKKSIIKNGYEIYKRLLIQNGKESMMLLFPYKGTGDVYLACGFLREYLNRHAIERCILVTVSRNCKNIIELFNFQNIYVISEEEMRDILSAWTFLGTENMNLKPLLHWGWNGKHLPYIDENKEISFIDMFRYDVFDLEDASQITRPALSSDKEYVRKMFDKLHLRKGKTIVISPYANSFISEMGMDLWEEMAKGLKERGYDVCTNCVGDEQPIAGTVSIFFPYSEVVNVLEYAGGFLALRSGLCEISSQANCKIVVFYEYTSRATSYDHFGLKKMGICDQEVAIIYEKPEDVNKIFEVWR